MNLNNVIAVRSDKTVYRDGNYSIKVFNEGYAKTDVLNEALNQARVENVGLNVPKVIEVMMIDGKWAIVSEYIEGKTLAALIEENPDKLDEYLDFFVKLQIEMHTKRVPLLTELRDKMRNKIEESSLDETLKFDLRTRLKSMPRHHKLCHGDFDLSNIIISPNGLAYILDWSHVTQGNASADIARTYLLFSLQGKDELAKKYLQLFCQYTNTDIRYVQSWMPIVAASQSVKGREEEKEFLLSWANVVDY